MEKADKVTIRLTAEQAQAIDFLVESGKFKNRSKAIRAAIDSLISVPGEEALGGPVRVVARLPDSMVAEIDTLVDLEYFRSREQGLWELVRNGLLQLNVEAIRERSKDRSENVAERNAKTVLDDIYSDFVSQ
jgi:Arc/MetJ-type ribon-helix-helix transcriptional regulator